MIDEQALYELGDAGRGPDVRCRPVAEVMARGTRLRRRRHALRAAGASTVVMGLVGTGLFVRGQHPSGNPDLQAGNDPTTATSDVPSSPPPPAPECIADGLDREDFAPGAVLAPADVADELRVIPTWSPTGAPITLAQGGRWDNPCPDAAPYPADDALLLKADGGDGITDALIRLSGPLPRPTPDGFGISQEPTQLRGGSAILIDPSTDDDVAFAWTEPDGWSWELTGQRVDEPTLRAVAEALALDSSPEGDEPLAALAPEAAPPGFEVAWQTLGAPAPLDPVAMTWSVEVGGSQGAAAQTGIKCYMEVRPRAGNAPFSSYGGIGDRHVTVDGEDAVWGTSPAGPETALTWQLGPDVLATAGCVDWDAPGMRTLPLETIVQLAESVVAVAGDDPRLPD